MPAKEPQCAPKALRFSEDAGYLEFAKRLLLEYPLLLPQQRMDLYVPATATQPLELAQFFASISPNVFLHTRTPDAEVPPLTPTRTTAAPLATPHASATTTTGTTMASEEASIASSPPMESPMVPPTPPEAPLEALLSAAKASADWIHSEGLDNPFRSGIQFPRFIHIDIQRDLLVSPARMAELKEQLWSAHFCSHNYTKNELLCVLFLIFKRLLADPELPQELCISDEKLLYFLTASRAMYKPQLPFHTLWHCVDVTQFSAYLSLNKQTPWSRLDAADRLALVLSGLGHDMLHSGLNTPTLVSIDPQFGINYGSLEKFHCVVFRTVLDQLWPAATEFWQSLIGRAIEATELAKHNSYFNIDASSPYFFVHVLKMSDFASTARFNDAEYDLTANKIYNEGCVEWEVRRLLDVHPQKPMMSKVGLQTAFLERFVLPYFSWLVGQVPALQPFLDRATYLRERYIKGSAETTPPA